MADQYDASQDQPVEPELLGGPGEPPARSGRRWAALGAASVAVVAAAGAGAWGVAQLMAGGTSPASAVPAATVAYLDLDLDPSAGQKIEALTMLKKFPALAAELDLDARDDVRRWVFEKLQEDGGCPALDYATDVEPWLGDRMAVAAAPGVGGELAPLVAVQVSNADAAADGVAALADCGGEEVATGFVGDYLLLGEDQLDVDVMAADAKVSALADDAAYQDWMARAGDPGIMSAYVSGELTRSLRDFARAGTDSALGPEEEKALAQVEELSEGFEAMAMVVRFADGGFEAEMVAGGLPGTASGTEGWGEADVASAIGNLPVTTAAAMSFALPDGWASQFGDDKEWRQLEGMTGLDLPADLEALLGEGVTLSVDAAMDLGSLGSGPAPEAVLAALQIAGDPAEISRVVDKLLALVGPASDELVVETTEDGVTIGFSRDYVATLVEGGDLGESETFRRLVPDVDNAVSLFYVDFDAGDGWAERLADLVSEQDPDVGANVEPLDGFGASAWVDGDVTRGLVRFSTD